MLYLIRKYGLFYVTSAITFSFLCAYSLVAKAPNFPFLPALFFPSYLSGAMAMSEKDPNDPLLSIMPVPILEIMKTKFGLAFSFVVVGWLTMTFFTTLQDLGPELSSQVIKLNTLSCISTLLLAALLQVGLHIFGWSIFHKVILGLCVTGGIFCLVFFIGLAESGHNHPDMFPLVPFLDSLPNYIVLSGVLITLGLFYFFLKLGPWSFPQEVEGF